MWCSVRPCTGLFRASSSSLIAASCQASARRDKAKGRTFGFRRTGRARRSRYPLHDDAIILGRGEESAIQIQDHSVSRKHARIELATDGFHVADLGSTNGTFVNDKQIDTARLSDGDYLRIGNCIYRFLAGGN